MRPIRPLIAGNWKMHGVESALEGARTIAEAVSGGPRAPRVAIFPPATLISRLAATLTGSPIEIGGQDCRAEASGPFTGDIAPEMLVDAGASLVILGHSERRAYHGESDAMVSEKVVGALRAGLEPIVCVGESLEQRRAGLAEQVVDAQMQASLPMALARGPFAVAYEPVWAIGTGLTPTLAEIDALHRVIRAKLLSMFGRHGEGIPILYGGSVKPTNASEILACENVDGALVGGASLSAPDFIGIIRAA